MQTPKTRANSSKQMPVRRLGTEKRTVEKRHGRDIFLVLMRVHTRSARGDASEDGNADDGDDDDNDVSCVANGADGDKPCQWRSPPDAARKNIKIFGQL